MKYNISKELFEAVYNCDITTDKDMLDVYKSINIYELAHKCKEWANEIITMYRIAISNEYIIFKD